MMATWTEEEIQEDKASQFEDMNYTIECNTCGETITTVLWAGDFDIDRPALVTSWRNRLSEHNMTHYVEVPSFVHEAPIPKKGGE